MEKELIEDLEDKVIILEGANNSKIVGNLYKNKESRKGIIMFPGLSEHRTSLSDMAKSLSSDFNTFFFDINSQGDSTGNWDLKEMAYSVYMVGRDIKENYKLEKLGFFGNSIGGMAGGIAASYEDSPLDALCLSTTGSSMFDYLPEKYVKALAKTPSSIINLFCKLFDNYQTLTNKHYHNLTHKKMKKHPFFGATKIGDPKKFFGYILNAPNLIDYADKIEQPVLLIKGEKDPLLSLEGVRQLYDKIKSGNKELLVLEGADHSLNRKTPVDSYFNHDPKYQYVKESIKNFFNSCLN